jgi:sulfur transfer complex TusBCD TusB component (DsrH family)
MAKKKAAKKKAKAKSKKEVLVVASKVKAYVKGKKMMTSSDAIAALSDKVYALLDDAVARTKANRRSTVKPQDL